MFCGIFDTVKKKLDKSRHLWLNSHNCSDNKRHPLRESKAARFNRSRLFFLIMDMDARKIERIVKAVEKFVPVLDEDLVEALDELRREAA